MSEYINKLSDTLWVPSQVLAERIVKGDRVGDRRFDIYNGMPGGAILDEYDRRRAELLLAVKDRVLKGNQTLDYLMSLADSSEEALSNKIYLVASSRHVSKKLGEVSYQNENNLNASYTSRIQSQLFGHGEIFYFGKEFLSEGSLVVDLDYILDAVSEGENKDMYKLLGRAKVLDHRQVVLPMGICRYPITVTGWAGSRNVPDLFGTCYQSAYLSVGNVPIRNSEDTVLDIRAGGGTVRVWSDGARHILGLQTTHQKDINEAIDKFNHFSIYHPYYTAFGQGRNS